jgi:hypothetical protein
MVILHRDSFNTKLSAVRAIIFSTVPATFLTRFGHVNSRFQNPVTAMTWRAHGASAPPARLIRAIFFQQCELVHLTRLRRGFQ